MHNDKGRESFSSRLFDVDCKVFAEVGVLRGGTVNYILNHANNTIEEYWAIDLWRPYESRARRGHDHYLNIPIEECDEMYRDICRDALPFKGFHALRMPSLMAATIFPLGYFDVVFIDGDHAHQSVLDDIGAWLPLVKKGGMLCGDDWSPGHPGVRKAVVKKINKKLIEIDEFKVWWHKV